MAARISSLVLLAAALFALAVAGAAGEGGKKVIVAVGGLVSCQDCSTAGTWDLAGAKPLPGAKLSITCKDHRRRVVLYKAAAADDNGYVFAELYTTTMRGGYFDPVEACTARLLVSPDERCSVATDVNGGAQAAQLRYENTTLAGQFADIDVYVVGPLAFRPAYCQPKTTQS